MLMKLALGVNFINILCVSFLYKSLLWSFSPVTFGFVIFWRQNIAAKVAHKMLMKLTIGVSQFCTLDLKTPQPLLENMIYQILKEFTDLDGGYYLSDTVPEYLEEMDPSIRYYGNNIFKQTSLTYNAFDEDVAMVEIIYQKSTLVQIQSQLAMTWIDYFSAVGGLMGLVLGMGFFSVFELIWLCLRAVSKKFGFSKWIP